MKNEFLNKFWPVVVAFVLSFIFTQSPVTAQENSSNTNDKYGVTYPVVELENCSDYAACRTYCEDPVHKDACTAYAKLKGFYKDDAVTVKSESIVKAAKVELGCDSFDSCQSYCQQETNRDKCDAFAKSHKLNGGRVSNPASKDIIKKAEEILGCSSEESCKAFCSDQSNAAKCSEFARSVGLRGGEIRRGPGGCISESTCRAFCQDPNNFDECAKFGGQKGARENFRGPGGCNSRESCESYCQTHSDECSRLNERQAAPVEAKEFIDYCKSNSGKCFYNRYCEENPEKCQKDFTSRGVGQANPEMGNCKTPGACYDWCKANPGKCQGFNPDAPRPDDSQYRTYTQNYDPASACRRGGCTWSNNSCQCGTSGYNYQSAYQYNPTPRSRDEQESMCRSGGGTCSWNGDFCYCQGYRSPNSTTNYSSSGSYSSGDMGSRESQEAACKAIGGYCTSTSLTFCGCSGSGSSGSTTTTTATTNTTSTTPPPGQTRDSQESACRSCGGTCNWSGDFCSCNCGSTSTSSNTTTTTTTNSQPSGYVATPEPDAGTACEQQAGCRWGAGTCTCNQVQGVSTKRNFWQQFMDWFKSLGSR